MPSKVESSDVPAPVASDLEFCPWCGSILPLVTRNSTVVKCQRCQFQRSVKEYESSVEEFTINFTEKKDMKNKKQTERVEEDTEALIGPSVERQCPRCKHDIMTYTTRQTRSADEGQTVFYTCVKCKFQDIEYS